MYATRGDRGRSRHRDRYNGSAATATAHVRVHRTAHARIKPPSVPNASTCREHEPPDDSKSMRRKHWPSMQSGPQDRRSAASVRLSGGLTSTAASTRTFAVMPTSRPLCFRPPSCCSHHLPPSTSQTVVWAPVSGCQLQQWSQGGLGIKEMLTRGDNKVCGGRRT